MCVCVCGGGGGGINWVFSENIIRFFSLFFLQSWGVSNAH